MQAPHIKIYAISSQRGGVSGDHLFPFSRQTFESDVLAPVSSPFCHSPPPESREIANELALAIIFDSGVREMCGNAVQNQPKPAENSDAKCNVF